MPREDTASWIVPASPGDVFAALVDPDALARWLPPKGMTGRFEHADIRTGGSSRFVLTYSGETAAPGRGKSTSDSDVVDVRYVEVSPNERIVQAVDFDSDDPKFRGIMTMTWKLAAVDDGARVEIHASDVPPGISAEDHVAGMASSLANLAAFVEADRP